MASPADATRPLLGERHTDPEVQQSSNPGNDDDNSKKKAPASSSSASHFFSRDLLSGSSFIGNLASWSRRGAEGTGISRSNSFYRQQQQQQQHQREHNEYYYDDEEYAENHLYNPQSNAYLPYLRFRTRSFLSSKWGHYLVLFMVAVDVACIFADFLIELRVCELRERHQTPIDRRWGLAQEALGLIGLIFSCLFMLELIASVLSFGMGYFKSKFHIFDAVVIVLAFILDVALRGVVEELGSLVVVLRLWRVFKIIEEMSDISAEMMEKYEEELEYVRRENIRLKRRLKRYGSNDDEEDDIEAGDEGDINE